MLFPDDEFVVNLNAFCLF